MSTQTQLLAEIRRLTKTLSVVTNVKPTPCLVVEEKWVKHLGDRGLSLNTVTNMRINVRSFVNYLVEHNLLAIGQVEGRHISNWLKHNSPHKIKLSTMRQSLSSIRYFFSWCVEHKYIASDPSRYSSSNIDVRNLAHEQKEPRRQTGFTDADLDKLMVVISSQIERVQQKMDYELGRGLGTGQRDRDRMLDLRFWLAAIPVLRWTGLRISDVCCLEWASVSEQGTITVWTRKRNKRIEHQMNSQVVQAMTEVPVVDPRYCFPRQRQIICSASRATISTQFGSLCEKAGLACTSVHQIRHLYAQSLAGQGVEKTEIARQLTHSSVETTEIYLEKPQPQL